ncbi:hypothetical protein R5U34_00260 [Enterococcus faecium]|uniref:hypothetical protein n=3 Tax=Enterococcus TaxID=1350 RepID=UPI00295EA5A1|nr:hypothetical protein [Enterococcus faecium]WOV50250.1 hypothetical protein R5U34_00260 [Enterococcus faecium]
MEKVSPYVFQTTYTSSPTDLSKGIFENKTIIEYDFTDAKFLDKNQNEVDKKTVLETMIPVSKSSRGASTSGGSWQSGSGYAICNGMKVSATEGAIGIQASYKVDFQHTQQGYDKLNRVYSALVNGIGSWTWLSNGVFRGTETATYSAYGGIKGQWYVAPGLGLIPGTSTKYCYFRVGNDRYWLDYNFK